MGVEHVCMLLRCQEIMRSLCLQVFDVAEESRRYLEACCSKVLFDVIDLAARQLISDSQQLLQATDGDGGLRHPTACSCLHSSSSRARRSTLGGRIQDRQPRTPHTRNHVHVGAGVGTSRNGRFLFFSPVSLHLVSYILELAGAQLLIGAFLILWPSLSSVS